MSDATAQQNPSAPAAAAGEGRKKQTKSPRRKAPTMPKKKKAPQSSKETKSHDSEKKTKALSVPGGGSDGDEVGGAVGGRAKAGEAAKESSSEKSLRRSLSPRKENYSSLLEEMAGKGDMVLLDPITEDAVIENLKKRYTAEEIYVCQPLNL